MRLILLLLVVAFGSSYCQSSNNVCPDGWITQQDSCYNFVNYPRLEYSEAARACQSNGAMLLAIDSEAEHQFIINRLRTIDMRGQEWYTSGEKDTGTFSFVPRYVWTATNVEVPHNSYVWISPEESYTSHAMPEILAYKYNERFGRYGVSLVSDRRLPRPYVCEISRNEAYRINRVDRGFDYGVPFKETDNVKRGPKLIVEAKEIVILGETTLVYFDCVAIGSGQLHYRWYRVSSKEYVSSDLDPRYNITFGRLWIQAPNAEKDSGLYQCMVSNSVGTIMGNPVQLSFRHPVNFRNLTLAPVTPGSYEGAALECPEIASLNGAHLRYQWVKETATSREFVRPDLNNYIFISGGGKLYFSDVTPQDNGNYRCIVTWTSRNENDKIYVGASQMPSRTSPPSELAVKRSNSRSYGPNIVDYFINVVPRTPVEGMDISLECFAYGSAPLIYLWEVPIWDNDRYSLTDSNRVLKISNVSFDDSGIFNCTVKREVFDEKFIRYHTDRRSHTFYVKGKPRFLLPLQDQHLDIGTKQLTWRCEARAAPFPTYSWYKDGAPLTNSSDGKVIIYKNTLHIMDLDKARDEGMYQCAAKNSYGETFSSAQLRILTVAPQFSKNPMSPTTSGAFNGSVTLQCRPEAAPFPEFTWLRNNSILNLSTDPNNRVYMSTNGDLVIQNLNQGDAGWYECRVRNAYGETFGRTYLNIYQQTTIIRRPTPVEVEVNETGFLNCQASLNGNNLDLVYEWAFNNRIIDIDRNVHFSRATGPDNEGRLYIINAQFDHTGIYTCIARTQVDSANASARVMVYGPPSPPARIRAYSLSTIRTALLLRWTDPVNTHGAPIESYVLYGKIGYSDTWVTLLPSIPRPATVIPAEPDPQRRQYIVQNLIPGVTYYFKLRAVNRYGIGDLSLSGFYYGAGAAPIKPPDNVGGGGGKVGTLKITWTPLPKYLALWGIGYEVQWREKPEPGQEKSTKKWKKAIVHGDVGEFTAIIGGDQCYVHFSVKVTPFNMYGKGPSGFNDTVYSAECLLLGLPYNVSAEPFNESAIIVHWEDKYIFVKGRIQGYKIYYWQKDVQDITQANYGIFYGNQTHGMISGLLPNTWYSVSVMAFNDAGNGLKSSVANQSTYRSAPLDYPENIEVYPHEKFSVRVQFKDLTTGIFEETLLGYKIRYWQDTENITQAKEVDVENKTEGFLEGIQHDTLYHLRVLGYSIGGDGKMSWPEDLFYYMRDKVTQIRWDPLTSEMIYVYRYTDSAVTFTGSTLAILLCLCIKLLLM